MAFLAIPAFGAPAANDLAARSAELDARAEALEVRAAALVCQFGGVKACSAEVRLLFVRQTYDIEAPLTLIEVRRQGPSARRLLQLPRDLHLQLSQLEAIDP
ncbi:MAG: hypothetical protein LQ338_006871 [Usnochroma carphineum]|nr:MAG: hypothetical protein LQ338_006871 [Usnochroma carphineum]